MSLSLGPLANAVHGCATNELVVDSWHDLYSRSFAYKGDKPTGEDTEGALRVEREARPVGLDRAENFLGQFPSNYETSQQPLPLCVCLGSP